jgi:NDP-sugar pyrophosphorylase family protein
MILAAGLGTRLGEIGAATPKVLIEVGGRTLLERHLEWLDEIRVERVVINVHHRAEEIERFVAQHSGRAELMCVREDHLLGTAGGVRNALSHLRPGPILVLYGDIFVQESSERILDFHRLNEAAVTLAVHAADSAEGKGTVEADERGRVTRFAEKQASEVTGSVLINSGIYVLETDVVKDLPVGVFCDFGEHVLPRVIEDGGRVFAYRLGKPVIDIGTPEGLAEASALATAADAEHSGTA